jgi:bifunctional NMN adenylyltransferase/nudix hydrolase
MNMEIKKESFNVGVIIARMQVPTPTAAHIELIETVLKDHPKVLIFLGLSPVKGTINNPLDFQPRKQMLLEAFPHDKYPNLTIGYIKDNASDKDWSSNLDTLIGDLLSPGEKAVLYGSRDSFIPHYKGSFPTRELVSTRYISGTEIRNSVAKAPQSNPNFRMGAIWATYQRYPAAIATVDVAVLNVGTKEVLLARKPNEILYRFVGGFVSPTDDSYEDAAVRELEEETGVNASPETIEYVGSKKIDDWRYRGETDKIITHLYLALIGEQSGPAKAADDIAEVRWFDLVNELTEDDIVIEHRPLFKMLAVYLKKHYKISVL